MRIRLRFVQGPRCSLIRCFHSDIFNRRNSHVRMSFQTERYDRYANEEDGYYAHNLNMATSPEQQKKVRMGYWIKNHINFSDRTFESMMKKLNFDLDTESNRFDSFFKRFFLTLTDNPRWQRGLSRSCVKQSIFSYISYLNYILRQTLKSSWKLFALEEVTKLLNSHLIRINCI